MTRPMLQSACKTNLIVNTSGASMKGFTDETDAVELGRDLLENERSDYFIPLANILSYSLLIAR